MSEQQPNKSTNKYENVMAASNLPPATRMNNIVTNAIITGNSQKLSPGRKKLWHWLGKTFRVVITDGRVLVGFFNCTDKDANVVLSMCAEYLEEGKDARILGNVMIPGKHIVSISVDMPPEEESVAEKTQPLETV